MNRFGILCTTVLLGVSGLLILSCSDNPGIRLRYEAEQMFYRVEKQITDARIKPELVGTKTHEEIADGFEEVIRFCFEAADSLDSTEYPVQLRELQDIGIMASNRLSQLYFTVGKHDTCITILNRLITKANLKGLSLTSTMINLGKAYQAAGHFDSAVAFYDRSLDLTYPPRDESGDIYPALFNLPAHMYEVASMAGDSRDSTQQLQRAISYYERLTKEFPTTDLDMAARTVLVQLYREIGMFEKTVQNLTAIVDSLGNRPIEVKIDIADIYTVGLRKFDSALALYDEILDELTEEDTSLVPYIMYREGLVRMEQKKYSDARKIFLDIRQDYPSYFASFPRAQYAIARSFEGEGNWNRAITEFNYLIEHFRGSEQAMSTFLHIVDKLKGQGRLADSERWRLRGLKYYDELAAEDEGTIVEADAMAHKASLFERNDDWAGSADILMTLYNKYPDSDPGLEALMRAAAINARKLGRSEVADSLLNILRSSLAEMDGNTWNN